MPRRSSGSRPVPFRAALLAAAGALALLRATPVGAQNVTIRGKALALKEVLPLLQRQTGYDFILHDPGRETEAARRDLEVSDAPLAEAIARLADAYRCDFFSTDYGTFRVLPLEKAQGAEVAVGPYRMRAAPPMETVEPGALQLVLALTAATEERVETIARLGPDLRVVDNFGRSMLGAEAPRVLTSPRTRLLEYRQRIALYAPDDRAVRLRSVSGSLVLYRKVVPLRVEFPLSDPDRRQEVAREGVQAHFDGASRAGREVSAQVRLSWPETLDVAGRGISRNVLPYLVDAGGRVYRCFAPRSTRVRENGEVLIEQTVRFDEVEAPPARLVYEMWVRSDPGEALPFRIGGLPLPPRSDGPRPEARPFFQADGGTLTLAVVGRDGRPIEGEVSLGVARKSGAGWTAWRWIEAVTGPKGDVRLDRFQPGVYRVIRLFRLAPGSRAVGDERPVDATVAPRKETALPLLRVSFIAPADP